MVLLVCSHMMPTTLNFEVLKKSTLLACAVLKGNMIDVRKITNVEIDAILNARAKTQSIGFSSLILELYYLANIIPCSNLSESVPCLLHSSLPSLLHLPHQSQPRDKEARDPRDRMRRRKVKKMRRLTMDKRSTACEIGDTIG